MTREEAIEWIRQICAYLTSGNPVWRNEPIIEACDIAIKAISAEPKHGRWIPVTNGRGGFECSLCHSYAPSYKSGVEWLSNYCPNCGARIDGTNKSVESVDLGNGFSISVNKSQVDTQGRYCPECLHSPTCYGADISKPACKAFVPRVRYVDGKDGGEK